MRSSISPIEDDSSWVSSGSSVHLSLFLCEYWLATDHGALRSLSSTLDSYHESTFKNVFESELRSPYRSGPFSEDAVQYSVWNVMFWHPVDMSCSAECYQLQFWREWPEFAIRNSSSFVILSSHVIPRRDLRHLRYLYVVQRAAPNGKILELQASYLTLVLVVRCVFFHTRSVVEAFPSLMDISSSRDTFECIVDPR